MKKLIFVTLLLHLVFLIQGQTLEKPYDKYPVAEKSVIDNFEINSKSTGKLDNYGIWRTTLIRNLFESSKEFADFKVYWTAPNSEVLKFVAHGRVRTHYRFSTILKEAGVYYCIFELDGVKKMIYVDARTLDLYILLATHKTKKQ